MSDDVPDPASIIALRLMHPIGNTRGRQATAIIKDLEIYGYKVVRVREVKRKPFVIEEDSST